LASQHSRVIDRDNRDILVCNSMPPLVTKLEFSKLCGVSQPAVVNATKKRTLKPAMVGKKLDIAHPSAVRYIKTQIKKAKEYEAGRKKSGVKSAAQPQYTPVEVTRFLRDYPEDIRKLADKSLRELLGIFGTSEHFESWLKALKGMEDVHKQRLANLEKERQLINVNIVKTGIIEPFNNAHKRLLTDGVRSLSKRLVTMIRADADEEKCEEYIRERMMSFIKGAKATAIRILEEMK
jgi:hypothetical protein